MIPSHCSVCGQPWFADRRKPCPYCDGNAARGCVYGMLLAIIAWLVTLSFVVMFT